MRLLGEAPEQLHRIPEPAAVLQYSVGASGVLTLKSSAPVPPGTLPGRIAVSPNGRSVYVVSPGGAGSVLQYTVAPDGSLTLKSPPMVPTGPLPSHLAISPDGRNLYVTSSTEGFSSVWQYTIGADGTLTPKSPPSVQVDSDPFIELAGIAVSPDGRSVYVVNSEALVGEPGSVLQFTVGTDGALTPKSPPSVPAGTGPGEVVVSPDGRSAYVTAGTVLEFTVGADGTLTPKAPSAVAAASGPRGIVMTNDGTSLYVANAGDNTVSQYAVAAGGTLVPRSPATVPAGSSPVDITVSTPPRVPMSKEQCKNGGYRHFGFKNQGQRVAFVERGGKR